jgi:hypothetical protein
LLLRTAKHLRLMDRLPHGGSWPFFGAHSQRGAWRCENTGEKGGTGRATFSGPASSLLSGCHGFLGASWRWSRLCIFPSWHSFILMTLLRNFTTNDERSSFKLDLVLGQSAKWGSSTGARGGGGKTLSRPISARRAHCSQLVYGWTGQQSSSGVCDLDPSILHYNWF